MNIYVALIVGIVPALAIGVVVVYLVREFLNTNLKTKHLKLKENARNTLLPVKLQAFERVVILLERIKPNNLVMRLHKPGKNAQYFQAELVKSIRAEFEHNLSQQLYVSDLSWKVVILAREEILQMLHLASKEVSNEESATVFSQKFLEIYNHMERSPIDEAIKVVKKEMMKFY